MNKTVKKKMKKIKTKIDIDIIPSTRYDNINKHNRRGTRKSAAINKPLNEGSE